MIVDSSAILAVAFQEPEAGRIALAIAEAPVRVMSCVSWLESLMVVEARHGRESADDTLLILHELGIQPIALDDEEMREALRAWRKFGEGRHPAALNMGDCCSCALAAIRSEPLMFKGEDFSKTDISRAAW